MSQNKKFRAQLLTEMASLYGRKIGPDWVQTFLGSVSDLSDAQLAAGIKAATQETEFLPTPAEIRRGCKSMITSRKAKSWQEGVNRQIRERAERHGRTIEEEIAMRQKARAPGPVETVYQDTLTRFGPDQAERELDDLYQSTMRTLQRKGLIKSVG